jgi:chondroitin 4-sulfotransferase 11
MIIDKEKTIFVHIPKNAGTSIKTFFECKEFYNKHRTIEQIKTDNIEAYNSYKKFAIIRNPYDRMISWYFYLKRAMGMEHTRGDHRWKSGEHFPSNFLDWIKDPLKNYYTIWKLSDVRDSLHTDIEFNNNGGRDGGIPLLSPQHDWLDDTVKVLKYENLKEEINKFFGEEIDLQKINKIDREEYLKYYNKESLNIVYNRYKEDFEKFNYKKHDNR